MKLQYRVYRLHQPTDLVFDTYGAAYNAGLRRYGKAYEFEVVEVWRDQ
jgi:hypothetical protein